MLGTTAAAAAALAAKAQTPGSAAPIEKPNIILYLADQFRWDFVGANRLNHSTHTPNLDAMAERGTLFTHAVTNQPVCSPSRSVMLTGRYATETGVWHNSLPIDPSLPTLAGELRKAGYTANLLGKWHLAPASEGPALPSRSIARVFLICGRAPMSLNSPPTLTKARSTIETAKR